MTRLHCSHKRCIITVNCLILCVIYLFVCSHQRSRIQIWLYEQVNMRIEGHIIVSVQLAKLNVCLRFLWTVTGNGLTISKGQFQRPFDFQHLKQYMFLRIV